ncbi:hypothetical protein D3C80_1682070 [compost metagenome]
MPPPGDTLASRAKPNEMPKTCSKLRTVGWKSAMIGGQLKMSLASRKATEVQK